MVVKDSLKFLNIWGQNYEFRRHFFSGKQISEQGLNTLLAEGEFSGQCTKSSCVTLT